MSPRVSAALRAAAIGLALGASGPAWAQPAPSPQGGAAGKPAGDPLLAKVGDQEIRLSDLQTALDSLPANVRQMPPDTLYPMLLDRLIDQAALAQEAERSGLAKDPAVQREVKLAETMALGSAELNRTVRPQITEEALKTRYEKEIANQPPQKEVHAEHILVDSEDQAKDIIAQLNKGADWNMLAKKYSKDTGAPDGGDLGFFKKDQMVPAFANAAFALQPGQITQQPVHTQFGWHVIKVLAQREAKPPTFDEAKDELRQQMAQEAAQKAVTQAVSQVKVVRYNENGAPIKPADSAVPPPSK
ncbi:MAG TPA: peptidylprolyl isomerase [Acetobacteraceae bacterium]|nr:peptidylprolyl isomerase [Acetobacteraceae bacterium]